MQNGINLFLSKYKYIEELDDKDEIVKRRVDIRYIKLKLDKFCEFYSTVMNCLPIFYEVEFTKNYNQTTPDPEENLCIICFERKNNVMLSCYVYILY